MKCLLPLLIVLTVLPACSSAGETGGEVRHPGSVVIADALSNLVDLRPAAIIRKFDLQRPIYSPFAAYGHMGREDLSAPWEACDLAPALNQALRK